MHAICTALLSNFQRAYDPCVANKQINGKQCTIVLYVDDSKISHVEEEIVNNVIKELENTFGDMVVTRGQRHNFMGMDFELKNNGEVTILTRDYLEECIDTFGE